MGSTLVIAECGSSWDLDLSKAERLINAAKECDAQIAKFQWTSDGAKMAARRGHPEWADNYRKWLQYPREWLERLKAMCDKAGIEFAVTSYLIEDIATIAPLVKRMKVSAFEATWKEFVLAHEQYGKPVIISHNDGAHTWVCDNSQDLLCVSEYPTPIDHASLSLISKDGYDGFSDHTANVLTGAAAVAAGAKIVEAHIRLWDTDPNNPDYKHSLECGNFIKGIGPVYGPGESFAQYVQNIRTVERML